jgi:general secretion pathway protein D
MRALSRHSGKWLIAAIFVAGLSIAGCSTKGRAFRNGEQALKNKNWDVAVAEYSRALAEDPNNPEVKLKFNMSKIFASRWHYEEAKRMLDQKKLQEALMELAVAVDLDPENKPAMEEYDRVKGLIENPASAIIQPAPPERPVSQLPSVALQPEFNPKPGVSIELKFKDTSLKEVLQTLGKLGDINVLFDQDFKDIPVSFDFHNTTFIQALDTVLTSTKNFYKVIGKNTIMMAPDTPQKRAEYEETVSRTFFLSNAEVEEIARTLRNVLGIQMVATNVRLNTVTIKDRITRVLAAEKIVEQLDKAKPEVVVDVEILEVNRSRMQQYGIQIASEGGDGIATTIATEPEKLRLDPGPILSRSNFFIVNFPQATLRLLKSTNDTKLLANLPLRTVVGETGRVRFGNQVPVPQTTFAPIATGGVNQQPITSFIYRDVGINIDITPRVHLNGEVTLEVIIESSAISGSGFGNLPQFSTSRVEKTIRLKEGETNIIAGLIRDEERSSFRGIPGLAEIPVLGRIFGANEKTIQETDVVLALSPHVIRGLAIRPDDEKMLWLGIEEQQGTTYRPYSPIPTIPPAYEEPPSETEEIPQEEEEPPPDEFQEEEPPSL